MSKYSKKVLYDYIVGNEIEGYDIDKLESDYIFIKEVTDFSNDKKIYNLCDNKLKSNFELMKFFILKFKDDKNFIKKVANEFLNLSNNEDDNFEMNIIVSNLVGKNYNELSESIIYALDAKVKYSELRVEYILEIEKATQEARDYYQMGFDYFADMYAGREIVIDFIAKSMVNEIFNGEEYSLEELIHTKFKSKEDLESFGIINFILNYVSSYDSHLSDYLKTNIKLVESLKNSIERIKNNFDIYNDKKRKITIEWIVDYLTEYSQETGYLSRVQLISYIAKDLEISDPIIDEELKYYDISMDEDEYNSAQSNIEYLKLKKKVKEVLNKHQIPEEEFKEKENIHKCKVLKFKKNGDKRD